MFVLQDVHLVRARDRWRRVGLEQSVAVLHEALEKIRKECDPVPLSLLLDPEQHENEPVQLALLAACSVVNQQPSQKGHGPQI